MSEVTALLSMLHEQADRNSATRLFRQDPVLSWTIDRLSQAKRLDSIYLPGARSPAWSSPWKRLLPWSVTWIHAGATAVSTTASCAVGAAGC